mmetsp:Transcript_14756/g.21718  ORF Transcript_14756/g.21718 Transcript_14756/m.21718 type:complete len:208 (-) Transcript_14756:469-1092(-)
MIIQYMCHRFCDAFFNAATVALYVRPALLAVEGVQHAGDHEGEALQGVPGPLRVLLPAAVGLAHRLVAHHHEEVVILLVVAGAARGLSLRPLQRGCFTACWSCCCCCPCISVLPLFLLLHLGPLLLAEPGGSFGVHVVGEAGVQGGVLHLALVQRPVQPVAAHQARCLVHVLLEVLLGELLERLGLGIGYRKVVQAQSTHVKVAFEA